MKEVLFSVLAYLLGSVPFGLLVAKAKGVNIREVGSGNIGATNVFRSIGKGPGIFTFVCDFLKGFIPAFVFAKFVENVNFGLLFGMLAILGHNYPIFLKFKGGKGIATSAGMLAGVAGKAVLWGIGSWLLVFLASGIVSLASILAAAVIAVVGWCLVGDYGLLKSIILTVLAVLAIYRHKPNIQRLLKGEENRFNLWKKK